MYLCLLCSQLDGELDLTDWVQQVCSVNKDAQLNAKAIPAFLSKGKLSHLNSEPNCLIFPGKLLPALKSAICLKEEHSEHPKTAAALVKLFKAWLNMDDEQKLNACGKDQRILAVVVSEIASLGCPASEGELAGWFTANRVKNTKRALEECHEHLKLNLRVLGTAPSADWGSQAV